MRDRIAALRRACAPVALILLLALSLSACARSTPPLTPPPNPPPAPTSYPLPETSPTPLPPPSAIPSPPPEMLPAMTELPLALLTSEAQSIIEPTEAALPQAPTAVSAEALPVEAPTAASPPEQPPPAEVADWRASVAAQATALQQNALLAGMTLAVHRAGEDDYIQGFGYADRELSLPTTANTVYPIGGLTQQFTAAAVMQLVEAGLLDLNTPIGFYLVGLPAELQSVTLHQLLSHTSGIRESMDLLELYTSPGNYTSQDLMRIIVPNLTLSSSSDGDGVGEYTLAGLVLEAVTGMSYYDYVYGNVIQRAGLRHTSFCQPPPGNLAKTYVSQDGILQPIQINTSLLFASGGLCSTAEDMLQWSVALASGRVVSAASYQKMLTAVQPDAGQGFYLGYGLYYGQGSEGLTIISYAGQVGFGSVLVSYPGNGVAIALLGNTASEEGILFSLEESLAQQLSP
jgi:CubicO group peptidase (beta-lactamase class C family)